jgi:hypothetical protein
MVASGALEDHLIGRFPDQLHRYGDSGDAIHRTLSKVRQGLNQPDAHEAANELPFSWDRDVPWGQLAGDQRNGSHDTMTVVTNTVVTGNTLIVGTLTSRLTAEGNNGLI